MASVSLVLITGPGSPPVQTHLGGHVCLAQAQSGQSQACICVSKPAKEYWESKKSLCQLLRVPKVCAMPGGVVRDWQR